MKISIPLFKRLGKKKVKTVKEMTKNGKNIYQNIKGHEDEVNYELYDIEPPSSELEMGEYFLNLTLLRPGTVNGEPKMSTGHSHSNEELYFVIQGKGKVLIDDNETEVEKGDFIFIPGEKWHRSVNTGKKKLAVITIWRAESKAPSTHH